MQILLSAGKCATIDEADFDLVKEFVWSFDGEYATSHKEGHKIYMHRLLMQFPKGLQVDHKDRNKLNNSRNNLRLATGVQNRMNSIRAKSNTLPTGVTKRKHLYVARIRANGVTHYLGSFLSAEEASKSYKAAQIKYHGAFASLN